jgi:HK97 family phage major capsid protein
VYATEEKTAEGFKAASERIDEVEEQTKEVAIGVVELAESIRAIQQQQKLFRSAAFNRQPGNEDRNRFWPDDEQAKSFGEIILRAMHRKVTKAMSEAGEGGEMVPTELATWIIQKQNEYGVFRRNAQIVTMGSSNLLVPEVTDDLTIYCPGEGNEIDESDMGFGQVSLVPRKLACLAKVSSEFEEDSVIAIGEVVGQSIARSMAKAEDLCGFLGDGTSTYFAYQGIIGALRAVDAAIANIKSLIVGSGNAYSELTLADFRKVCGILPQNADAGARWYMHKSFFFNVVLPLLWAETAGMPIIGTPTYFEQGPTKFLLGYPVEFTTAMPKAAANSQICALLADLKLGCFLGERRSLNIARSEHVFFKNDQIAIRGLERIAINAYGVGDTTDAGPICGLITAAA